MFSFFCGFTSVEIQKQATTLSTLRLTKVLKVLIGIVCEQEKTQLHIGYELSSEVYLHSLILCLTASPIYYINYRFKKKLNCIKNCQFNFPSVIK